MSNAHPLPHPQPGAPPRERGLGYAILGGLAITLVAMLIGGSAFALVLLTARGPAPAALLPADTQLYLALTPNVGGVVEVPQLRQKLREELAIIEPDFLLPAVERLAIVPLNADNLGTWLGSDLGVAVRGVSAATLSGEDSATVLLRDGEVVFFFGSKNDPQAEAFLVKHHAAREAQGESFQVTTYGDITLYTQLDGPPSPLAAFALIEHYVFFSNSPAALIALAEREPTQATLAQQPAFTQTPAGRFSDGSADAEAARAALRALLLALGEP
jgi:hypothetical protein